MTNLTDPKLADMAERFLERFDEYFDAFMADYHSKDIEDPNEREMLRTKLLSLRLNDRTKNYQSDEMNQEGIEY